MQPETPLDSSLRLCSTCLTSQPIEQFRHRRRGRPERVGECSGCHAARERQRRAKGKEKWLTSMLGAIAQEGRSPRTPGRLSGLASEVVRRLGGPDPFTRQLVAHLRAAPPGSRRALVGHMAIMEFFIAACKAVG